MKIISINALQVPNPEGFLFDISLKGDNGIAGGVKIGKPAPPQVIFEEVVSWARKAFPGESLEDLISRLQKALRIGSNPFRCWCFASGSL